MSLKQYLKSLYHKLPYKRKIFEIIRDSLGTPNQSIYQHLYFKGCFDVKSGPQFRFKLNHYGYVIENEIFWKGLYGGLEKESLKVWTLLSKNANVIFDIGANTGVYSLIAKTANPKSHVYAFEPISRVFNKLVDNIKVNNFDIAAYQVAVSSNNGTATIYDTPSEHQYNATLNLRDYNTHTNTNPVEVKTVTLSSFIQTNNISAVDLIKIDVERHEEEVLQGFLPHLFELQPTILIEVIDDAIASFVNKVFSNTEYFIFSVNENKGLTRVNEVTYNRRSDSINYLLCTRATAEFLIPFV